MMPVHDNEQRLTVFFGKLKLIQFSALEVAHAVARMVNAENGKIESKRFRRFSPEMIKQIVRFEILSALDMSWMLIVTESADIIAALNTPITEIDSTLKIE